MKDSITRKYFNWKNIKIIYYDCGSIIIDGKTITDNQVVKLFGVLDGSEITITKHGTDYNIRIQNRYYEALRSIYKNSYGNWCINNVSIEIIHSKRRQGIGTRILGYQVKNARKLGFKLITTIGVRSNQENGYYTWPVLGFDGTIPAKTMEELEKKLIFTNNVQELISNEEGLVLWGEYGTTIFLEFDLDLNSQSSQIHKYYLLINKVKL